MLGATLARILVLVALAATALARDFYQVLGLDRSCSEKDLKRACTSTALERPVPAAASVC
jgi:hypothetical protein